jgi:glucokinase
VATTAQPTALSCGLDLGGTKLLGLVIDPARPDQVLATARVPTPHRNFDALLAALTSMVKTLGDEVSAAGAGTLRTVGLGAPGLVDRDGVLRLGPNLPGVVDAPLAAKLAEATGLDATADNDATCATWGEHEMGAARGYRDAVMCTLGTGIGAGIVAEGKVLRGTNGFAGEPGHMVVDPYGPPCPCGRRGCWERYGSGSGLARLARDAATAGRIPAVVHLAGGNPGDIRGEDVTAAAADGERGALAVLEEFGRWVALGVANLVNVLDPQRVVIGGGLVEAGELIMDPICRAVHEIVMVSRSRPEVEVVRAQLGEQAGAIGAALLAAARA